MKRTLSKAALFKINGTGLNWALCGDRQLVLASLEAELVLCKNARAGRAADAADISFDQQAHAPPVRLATPF
ncbi:hypothetical protein [Pseudovibrio axinellae]|uniref:hypothetical protein n=1 Tax=Pseudovibrio axinellae TaxID=989403 RepID=UPI00082D2FCB|nr:hypothetical protein [Pseudovibrio axinellae]